MTAKGSSRIALKQAVRFGAVDGFESFNQTYLIAQTMVTRCLE